MSADFSLRRHGAHVPMTGAQVSTYNTEHMLAYLVALGAIVMGVIGLLVGFDVISNGAEGDVTGGSHFWNGVVWLLPAISAALLSMALHRTDHHLTRSQASPDGAHEGMWQGEHWTAWLVAAGAVAMGVIGILVGFNVIGPGVDMFDGVLWGFASVGAAVLTNTLHAVRHHQIASDEDYIVGIVDERISVAGRADRPR
ncbi:MAG: hypothetical protein IT304_05050 [Dehalococcoidia bacterium]|nr:hypothetical protein [Dehalococcoidia bacterium]